MAVVGFLMVNWAAREPSDPPTPPFPDQLVQLGTNIPPVGAHLFAMSTRSYRGRVGAVEPMHRFAEGETAPGVLVCRGTMSLWVRQASLGRTALAAD